MAATWKVRLSAAAKRDLVEISLWTRDHFGRDQAAAYRRVILDALRALEEGPTTLGVRSIPGLPGHLRVLHVARKGKRGRHVIVFDPSAGKRIQVLRILHDAMDVARHVGNTDA